MLHSGLDVTVIRPGQIVGVGGRGFGMMVSQAKKPVSMNLFSGGRQKMRNIAIDDLVYYLVGVLNDPRAYGQSYDVGCDDLLRNPRTTDRVHGTRKREFLCCMVPRHAACALLTNNQMIDVAAEVLGRRHPMKVDVPRRLLRALAPLFERAGKLPKGSIRGVLDGAAVDLNGDPMPIRAILPRPPLPYRKAVERALTGDGQ